MKQAASVEIEPLGMEIPRACYAAPGFLYWRRPDRSWYVSCSVGWCWTFDAHWSRLEVKAFARGACV